MTEERKLQITKLLNEYIPKIFSLDTLDDLDKLSIQDLITIFSEARIMVNDERRKYNEHEKTLFKGKIFKVLETLVTKIKTADKLYVVLDKSTLLPYFDGEKYLYIYSEKDFIEEAIDYFRQQYREFDIIELNKNEIFNFFGTYFYFYGANGIVVDNGQSFIKFNREDFLEKEIFLPKKDFNLVINPEFMSSLILFLQETRWHVNYEGRDDVLKLLEDNMWKNFKKAQFVIPMIKQENVQELKEGTNIEIPNLKNNEGNIATPIFSDVQSLKNVFKADNITAFGSDAKGLITLPNDTLILNVNNISVAFTKEQLTEKLK